MEEDRMASLVHLLSGEEVLLLLLGRRVDVGGEVVGDGVLAVEEHRVRPQRGLALDVAERLPALAILRKVEVVRLPVALLPAPVQIVIGDLVGGGSRVLLCCSSRHLSPFVVSPIVAPSGVTIENNGSTGQRASDVRPTSLLGHAWRRLGAAGDAGYRWSSVRSAERGWGARNVGTCLSGGRALAESPG